MFDIPLARDRRSLIASVAIIVAITVFTNGLIFGLGWAGPSSAIRPNHLLPPGWAIGSVWVVLLALLGVAFWWLASDASLTARKQSTWVLALIAFCLAYPFYTFGMRSEVLGFMGNLATMVVSAALAGRVLSLSRLAAALIFLTTLWVTYATYALMFGR